MSWSTEPSGYSLRGICSSWMLRPAGMRWATGNIEPVEMFKQWTVRPPAAAATDKHNHHNQQSRNNSCDGLSCGFSYIGVDCSHMISVENNQIPGWVIQNWTMMVVSTQLLYYLLIKTLLICSAVIWDRAALFMENILHTLLRQRKALDFLCTAHAMILNIQQKSN